ncbi:MAG: hypothetical protein ABL986_19555 [Vicinamibacterales bacterium]
MSLANVLAEKRATVVIFTNQESEPGSWLPGLNSSDVRVEIVPAAEAATLDLTSARLQELKVQTLVVDSYETTAEAFDRVPVPLTVILDAPPPAASPAVLIVNGSADAASVPHQLGAGAHALLGPDYVMLRREFAALQPRTLHSEITNVLVTTGGADPTGLSLTLVEAVRDVLDSTSITVVVGPYFSENVRSTLQQKASVDPSLRIVLDPRSVCELMLTADLALTSGGQTAYELAAAGLPACAVRVAPNQTGNLSGLQQRGAILWVGDVADQGLGRQVRGAIAGLARDPQLRRQMSQKGQQTVDGLGAVRVADAVLELCA